MPVGVVVAGHYLVGFSLVMPLGFDGCAIGR